MNRLRQMRGFTLIELIVVVIIIGILAAIAAVAYNQFVSNARKTALSASAKQIATAINVEMADKNALPTPLSFTAGSTGVSPQYTVGANVIKADVDNTGSSASATSVVLKKGSVTCTITVPATANLSAAHVCS